MWRVMAAVLVGAAVVSGCAGGGYPEGERGHDSPVEAAAFRYAQRLSSDGTMPENALLKAKAHRDAMPRGGGAAGVGWEWIGPGNIGGRIRAIVIHPVTPDVMWVGSASGGIWKTTDGGASWFPLDDFLPSLSIGCMAMDPNNPDVLYAGTGEGFFETIEGSSNTAAVRGAGVFRSVDGGATWNQIPSTSGPGWYFVNRLAFAPGSNQVMLAATNSGLYRSVDAGGSWTLASAGIIYDVQFHPADPLRAVAGGHDTGPRYTEDGGVTWKNAAGAFGHRVELRYAPGSPQTVYAAVSNAGNIKIHRSQDGGKTYTLMTSGGGVGTYEAYNNVLWVDPTNASTLVVGGVFLYRSMNAGVNLPQTFGQVHADMHVITPHPGFNGVSNKTVFIGCDGGIYKVADVYGQAATELNNNLGITQFYGAAIHDTTGVVLGGTQDNGTLRYQGSTETWAAAFGGDGGYSASDPTDPNYFYGEVQRLNIFRSTNGGVSASYIFNGITDAGTLNCNFIPYFMLDPNDPNRMLAAGRRLWRSNNVKAATPTWSIIKQPLGFAPPQHGRPDGSHFAENDPRNISTIAVAEGNPDIIWVGHNNGQVWKTANGTAVSPTWTRVDVDGVGLPDRWIARIVIDRADHSRVYIAVMGWHGDNVWRTTNGGATWADISGAGPTGLPDAPVSALARHRQEPGWLYAGTEIGLFTSTDDGANWEPSDDGLGLVPVEELVWRNDTTLMAVTHGRGIYLADATLDECYPDCDGNGGLDIDDFVCFQTLFAVGDPGADCDGDAELSVDDFVCFQTYFAVGCP